MTNLRTDVQQTPADIQRLAGELNRIASTKKDYIVPASALAMDPTGTAIVASLVEGAPPVPFEARKIAHEHLAEKLGIHATYYKKMQGEAGDLLAENVNYWFKRNQKNHLLRTLDGEARALLSDAYRVIDNYDLFFNTLQVVQETGAQVLRADLTEEKLYMRAVHPEWAERIQTQRARLGTGGHRFEDFDKGDGGTEIVIPSVVVKNSEVGRGGLTVEPGFFFQWCSNLAIADKTLFQVHIGGKNEIGEYITTETRELQDRALWSKVRDLIRATFDREGFKAMVARFQDAAETMLPAPTEAVDAVCKDAGLSDEARQSILNKLIADGDSTLFGLMNAITYQGHQARESGDVEQELVYAKLGGDLLGPKRSLVIK